MQHEKISKIWHLKSSYLPNVCQISFLFMWSNTMVKTPILFGFWCTIRKYVGMRINVATMYKYDICIHIHLYHLYMWEYDYILYTSKRIPLGAMHQYLNVYIKDVNALHTSWYVRINGFPITRERSAGDGLVEAQFPSFQRLYNKLSRIVSTSHKLSYRRIS